MELVRFPANPPPVVVARPKTDNKILAWSFLASLLINAGVGLWLGFAHLGGTTQAVSEQHRAKIQLYRPPVTPPKKPKALPVPPKPVMPLPPKPVRQALTKPLTRIAALPPRTIPRAVPQPQRPPAPMASPRLAPRVTTVPVRPAAPKSVPATILRPAVKATVPSAVSVAPMTEPARVAVLPNSGRNTTPPATAPQTPVQQAPVKQAPVPQVAARQDPVKPANYRDVTSQQADLTNVPQPETNGIDPATLNGPCVISVEIDENGHVSNPRIKQRSGNSDFDDACLKAIRRARGIPAVQDHIAHAQRFEYTFSAG